MGNWFSGFLLGLMVGACAMFFFLPADNGSGVRHASAVAVPEPVASAPLSASGQPREDTLSKVRERGYLMCGVTQGLPGFSSAGDEEDWTGLDVDVCRAVAAAVLGDASKVRFRPLSAKDRFTVLQSGEIDVLSRITTWTITRDSSLGLDFTTVNYYDGQGFMVRKDSGIEQISELDGATICTNTGTTTELNLADYFRAHGLRYKILAYEKNDEVIKAYDNGRCDATTTDQSGLYAERLKLADPSAHKVLTELISKEPLAPVVRQGDDRWADIVRWVQYAMVDAEELGITSKNVDGLSSTTNPQVQRFLGLGDDYGAPLGLDAKWAARTIEQVGNYGESFDRNVGMASPLQIERGVNALWTQGGLMYGMPIR